MSNSAIELETKGRRWLLWSFILCPCHLPWTLAVLMAVSGGTFLGAALREHIWIAGAVVTTAWIAGTAYGFRLIRLAEKSGGACSVRVPT
ncbi:MAG: hypothetical protein KDA95_01580 [Acidimicrobiales bacterium]|nr:hypothetical protein [Acidimicrobiales bacterium]